MIEIEIGMGMNGTIVLMIGAMTAITVGHLAKALVTVGQNLVWVGNVDKVPSATYGIGPPKVNIGHTTEMTNIQIRPENRTQQEMSNGADIPHSMTT